MAEVDTSSYPKAGAQPSLFDLAGKIGAVQQQKLQIDQAKLDQANQGLKYMTRAMGALGPDATKEQYIEAASTAVKMGLVPEQALDAFKQRAEVSPTPKDFYNEFMTTAADHQQQIDYHLGRSGELNTGQTVTPTVTSVKPGFGQRPTGMPVQIQTPPSAVVTDANNQQTTVGPQAPQVAPGAVAGPTPLGVGRPSLPAAGSIIGSAIPGQSSNFGGRVVAANAEAPTNPTAAPQPHGYTTAPPPNFEEGKKMLAEDQANATAKMTAVKPAILALKLLPGLRTGPGTEPFNKAVAFLKANNLISTAQENDPTVIYQEANKYLSQYLKGRGGRSDADLAAAEKSSPNVGVQLNPALQNLAKSAIAQDMIEAARPTAFTGKDYQNYGQHRATFPQSVDQRAFEAAIASPQERQKLVDRMHTKYEKNPKDPEALKFFKSLDIAKKAGMFNIGEE